MKIKMIVLQIDELPLLFQINPNDIEGTIGSHEFLLENIFLRIVKQFSSFYHYS